MKVVIVVSSFRKSSAMAAGRMAWTGVELHDCTVTVCVAVIFIVVVVKLLKNLNFNEPATEEQKIGTSILSGQCKFPDCVRCRRHKDVLMRARTRLTYCENSQDVENSASASAQLVKDIQDSYHKLTKDIKQEAQRDFDLNQQNSLIFHVKGIQSQPVWSSDDFSGLDQLTEKFEEIQGEFFALTESVADLSEGGGLWKVNDTPSGKWMICHLLDQGVPTEAVAACPITWQIVTNLPGVMKDNLFGNVAFSVTCPGTKIAPHFGPTNIRIRCHLGLQVPEMDCMLSVGNTSLQWSEGKIFCFDETYLHAVEHTGECNHSSDKGARGILIVDLWHPGLSLAQRSLIDYAFSPETVP